MGIDVDACYRRYAPLVLRRCRAMLYDEEAARDAMQDVFVRLLKSRETLVADKSAGLLYCIATNVCLNIIRSRRRKPESPDQERIAAIADIDSGEAAVEANDMLDRIFVNEAASTRVIAMLHYGDGLTLSETAAASGLSVSGVRKRLRTLARRARAIRGGKT